jgi:hypothetical protein
MMFLLLSPEFVWLAPSGESGERPGDEHIFVPNQPAGNRLEVHDSPSERIPGIA